MEPSLQNSPTGKDTLGTDLVWGAAAIAAEIGRTKRQTNYLLETSRLPATKIGRRWVASRSALRGFFAAQFAIEAA